MAYDRRTEKAPGGPGQPELEAEQEVDVARYWWAIVARWWLVALAIALGVLVGYLVSLGGGPVYQAKATIYLGQPLAAGGNAQVQGLGTNPSTVNQIVKSESVVRAVAAQVDVPPARLRAGISSKAVAGAVARVGQTQLVEVSVRGPWRRQSAEAANLLADTVIERISGYPDAKIELLEGLLANQDEQLAAMQEAIDRYKSAVETDTTLSGTDRLVLVGLLDDAQQERGQLLQQKTDTELSLALARGVERGQVVTRATAAKVSARGRSSSMVVGAVIGLLAGIALALGWEPLRSRLGRSQAPA